MAFAPQLAVYSHKCENCGECLDCPENAVRLVDGKAETDRDICAACGKCAEKCVFSARELFGREVDVDNLVEELCIDRGFFENSGGGVTLSGGECLAQPEFALELLKKLKEKGINTAVDTCGCVPRAVFEKILPYVDSFLYDIKAIDPVVHEKCTGRDNSLILSNFDYICSQNCDIEVRIPFVVGLNDGEIEKIGELLREKPIKKVTVLKYHDLARSKFESLGMLYTMPENKTDTAAAERAVEILRSYGLPAIGGWED
jgi:pyruvate formate lyase activating enzyme